MTPDKRVGRFNQASGAEVAGNLKGWLGSDEFLRITRRFHLESDVVGSKTRGEQPTLKSSKKYCSKRGCPTLLLPGTRVAMKN